jgi:hypothetical protein
MAQLAAFIQQRVRHVCRRQRTAPLPSRTAQHRHQSQLGIEGLLKRTTARKALLVGFPIRAVIPSCRDTG